MSRSHRIRVANACKGTLIDKDRKALIKKLANLVLARENVDFKCKVEVLYTDNNGIQRINKEHRKQDKPTDVLSFPSFDFRGGDKPYPDPDSGKVYLGDIVISIDKAKEQAEEYGHSEEREIGYLTVHAMLHLLGYDHENETDMEEMRSREEAIMNEAGIART